MVHSPWTMVFSKYLQSYILLSILSILTSNMSNVLLLQIDLKFIDYKFGILAFVTAFVVAMIVMPPLIKMINRFKLFDVPDLRKEHSTPIPTMGGIASCAGMMMGCILWF